MVRFLEEAHLAEEVQTGTEDGVGEDLKVVPGPFASILRKQFRWLNSDIDRSILMGISNVKHEKVVIMERLQNRCE